MLDLINELYTVLFLSIELNNNGSNPAKQSIKFLEVNISFLIICDLIPTVII